MVRNEKAQTCPAPDCDRQTACRPPAPTCPHPFYGARCKRHPEREVAMVTMVNRTPVTERTEVVPWGCPECASDLIEGMKR